MEALTLASYVLKTQKNYREIDIGGAGRGDIARLAGTVATIALFVMVLGLSA